MNKICKHCGYSIEDGERVYEVENGLVHEDCIEEYVDNAWDNLNLVNKLQLLGIKDKSHSHNTLTEGDIWDRQYEDSLEEAI